MGRHTHKGFTLVEMAFVVVVMGLILLAVLPTLSTVRQSTQTAITHDNLKGAMRAVAAFVQAHGCVPCPTPANRFGAGFGRVRGDEAVGAPLCGGSCVAREGILPFVSLGMPARAAQDGWGRWMTYAVDTNLTQNFGIVPPTRPCTSAEMTNNPTQCRSSNHAQNGLCRSNLPPSGNMRVMQTMGSATDTDVAVLLLSHGKNGYGAFQASASSETTLIRRLSFPPPPNSTVCSDGGVEQCNGQGGDNGLYYDRDHVSNAGDVFDDVLLYYDRNQLVALLGGAACQTSWGAP